MGAQPKKKRSVSRKGRHRAHISANVPHLVSCPQCRSPRRTHTACAVCGTYNGRQVLQVGIEPGSPAG